MRKLLFLFLLTGCAATPYGEIGLGYKFNQWSDWHLRTEHAGGRNPTAHFEAGLEWNKGYSCGLHHWSHLRDGGPFNDRPETYLNEIICKKRWSGK